MLRSQQELDELRFGLQGPLHEVCIGGLGLKEPGEVRLHIIDRHAVRDFQGSSVQLQSNKTAVVKRKVSTVQVPIR